MNIGLTLGDSDLHNKSDVGVVDSSSGHIGSKHDLLVAGLELLGHFSTVGLRLTRVHFTHGESCFTAEFGQEASHPCTNKENHDLEVAWVLFNLVLDLVKNCHDSLF
jgi:hypothetical protein